MTSITRTRMNIMGKRTTYETELGEKTMEEVAETDRFTALNEEDYENGNAGDKPWDLDEE